MAVLANVKQLGAVGLRLLTAPSIMARELRLLLRSDVGTYYDFLGDDVLEAAEADFAQRRRPLWLNLGYWDRATTYVEACAALARRLAQAARLQRGDVVLDAGFGFAEQDLLWAREYGTRQIVGINVTRSQVAVAKQRVAQSECCDRIALCLGSATALPLGEASVDKVVALESAFHFDTREHFFKEAYRVLRPGGRLATADCLPYPGEDPDGLVNRLGWRRWSIPRANIYDHRVYADKLRDCGFEEIETDSIRDAVFPGMHHYGLQRRQGVPRGQEHVVLTAEDRARCLGVEVWRKQGGLTDYVVFSARKPEQK